VTGFLVLAITVPLLIYYIMPFIMNEGERVSRYAAIYGPYISVGHDSRRRIVTLRTILDAPESVEPVTLPDSFSPKIPPGPRAVRILQRILMEDPGAPGKASW
jgi:hypothetical protein